MNPSHWIIEHSGKLSRLFKHTLFPIGMYQKGSFWSQRRKGFVATINSGYAPL